MLTEGNEEERGKTETRAGEKTGPVSEELSIYLAARNWTAVEMYVCLVRLVDGGVC